MANNFEEKKKELVNEYCINCDTISNCSFLKQFEQLIRSELVNEIKGLVEVGIDPKTISTMLYVKNKILKLIKGE